MFHFLHPKFRFGLFVLDSSKSNFNKNYNSNNSHLPVICYADTYEIKEDGSIVFYQTIKTDEDKRFKVPVLSYPHGKWEACVLLDDQNDFPVFKGSHQYSRPSSNSNTQEINEEELDFSNSNEEEASSISQNFARSLQDKNFQSPNVSHQQHILGQSNLHTTGTGMPGFNNLNPQEFKKQKEEWLESEIKSYVKDIEDSFELENFLSVLQKKPQNKTYKITDTDIIWSASKLIRAKAVMSRQFSDSNTQKTLSLILPDIMKRQWDGKMAPILQILQEREETKNVNAIDLAVWMVQNNYGL